MADDFDWSWYPAERDARVHARIEAARNGDNEAGRKAFRDCITFLGEIDPRPQPLTELMERMNLALAATADQVSEKIGTTRPRGRPSPLRDAQTHRQQVIDSLIILKEDGHTDHPLGEYLAEILQGALVAPPRKVGQALHINAQAHSPTGKRSPCHRYYREWLVEKVELDGAEALTNNNQLSNEFLDHLAGRGIELTVDGHSLRDWIQEDRPGLILLGIFDTIETTDEPPDKCN